MFTFIYLNKKKNLIDIRLKTPINSNNFHELMENLGIINIILVLCWELDIKYIKIEEIIGKIVFGYNYSSYNLYQSFDPVNTNYIELVGDLICLNYNGNCIQFNSGFLNFKANEFPMYKAKIRPDIIQSNGSIPNKEKKEEIFKKLSINKNSFMVLAADSDQTHNAYKLFIPDTFNKNELKYVSIIEKIRAPIVIKPKSMKTRSYALLFYSFDNNQYKPSDIERAVKFLQIHGYIVEYRTGRFQYIKSGVLVRIDAAQSEKRWAKNSGAFKKGHRGAHDNHGHISPASSDAENDLDLD